jgi:hypothetical protein
MEQCCVREKMAMFAKDAILGYMYSLVLCAATSAALGSRLSLSDWPGVCGGLAR